MIKLTDLDDLNSAVTVIRKALAKMALSSEQRYWFKINLYWPTTGIYHLDADVLASLIGKELAKSGKDMARNGVSCGLLQNDARAGEIEITVEVMTDGAS